MRSPSPRLKVGSVIVKDNRIISSGYNGYPSGSPHISIVKDNHEQNAIHSEQNSISDAAKRGSSIDLSLLMQKKNWNEIVVKPTISGAAKNTYRLKEEEIIQFGPTWEKLIYKEDFIVQEFQNNVITEGEVAMIVIGGKFTHAVLKKAKEGDFRVQDDFGGSIAKYNPSEEMVKLAEKCTRILTPIPSYARVDIIWDNLWELAVSELELIEPELWFRLNPNAAQKLAHHVDLILSEKK